MKALQSEVETLRRNLQHVVRQRQKCEPAPGGSPGLDQGEKTEGRLGEAVMVQWTWC